MNYFLIMITFIGGIPMTTEMDLPSYKTKAECSDAGKDRRARLPAGPDVERVFVCVKMRGPQSSS